MLAILCRTKNVQKLPPGVWWKQHVQNVCRKDAHEQFLRTSLNAEGWGKGVGVDGIGIEWVTPLASEYDLLEAQGLTHSGISLICF